MFVEDTRIPSHTIYTPQETFNTSAENIRKKYESFVREYKGKESGIFRDTHITFVVPSDLEIPKDL